MKSLKEKKMLVNMARLLGQPVEPAFLESIRREEELNEMLFKAAEEPLVESVPTPEEPPILVEVVPPETAQTNIVPKEADLVTQVANSITPADMNPAVVKNPIRDKELDAIRKTLAEMMQKISTLSWGGGGSGAGNIGDMKDFDYTSYAEGRYLKWSNGLFRLDEINSQQVAYNTTTTATNYTVVDNDYYIGVTAGPVTITLPSSATSGRTIVIKDETGNAQNNNITIAGTIDNDAGGAILAINNGAVQLLFRNGWRII